MRYNYEKLFGLIMQYKQIAIPLLIGLPLLWFVNLIGLTDLNYNWSGFKLGQSELLGMEGRTFFVDYDVETRKGCLEISIRKRRLGGLAGRKTRLDDALAEERICQNRKGRLEAKIESTGTHYVWFKRRGTERMITMIGDTDINYTAHWGID